MVDSLGTTTYNRDEAGRLTSVTDANGNTVAYTYDENGYTGLLTTLTYPGSKQLFYTYDELNRLKTIMNWLGQTAVYDYDNAGRLISLTNFNGTVTSYTHDDADRLTAIDSRATDNSVIASFIYTLDGNGNRIGIDKQVPSTSPFPMRNETADYTKNRLNTAGTASFSHDDEGQLSAINDGTTTNYSFDDAHRLTGVSGATTDLYSYDGAGNRLKAIRDGIETRYIYDSGGNLLAEADNTNTITRYYIHGAGLLAAVTPTNETYCYHYDAIGSTVAITDSSENIVNFYDYTPFGVIINESETFLQPFKYVGRLGVMEEDNGFFYMRARYYDPITGRFISEDPLGFEGGDVNLYVYVKNNPVLYSDPTGLWTFSLGITISGGLGAGGGGGTFINIGHDPSKGNFGGWSASLTGTAEAGAFAGAGASTQFVGQLTNANNVSQLEGSSLVAGKAAGVGIVGGIEFVQGADYQGVGISGGFGSKSIYAAPVSTYAFGSTTSGIVGYSQGK